MSITAIGLIIIILSAAALCSGNRLLPWLLLLICLPLQASSVVIIGDENSIDPRYFLMPIACFWPIVQFLFGKARRCTWDYDEHARDSRLLMTSLWIMLLWAIISTAFFPLIFSKVIVAPYHATGLSPLVRSSSNWKHLVYLTICVFTFRIMLSEFSCWTVRRIEIFSKVFYGSLWVAVSIILWHTLSLYLGIPFPVSFFQNNPGSVLISGDSIRPDLGVDFLFRRPSGTFSEPSYASLYITPLVWLVTAQFTISPHKLRQAMLLFFLLPIIILSTSTTAYLSCAAAIFVPLIYGIGFSRQAYGKARTGHMTYAAIFTFTVCLVLFTYSRIGDNVSQLFSLMVVDKINNDSSGRLAGEMQAMTVFASTKGIGAGLGTNQCVTLESYVAVSLGIPGILLLLYAMWHAARFAYKGIKRDQTLLLYWAAVSGQLLVGLAGVPILLEPSAWIIFALAIGRTHAVLSGLISISEAS